MDTEKYNEYIKKAETSFKNIVEDLKKVLSGIRTSRPTVGLVEDIKVDYYGNTIPIKQLGTINIHPPREIEIQVWDKNAVSLVAKAIETSDINLSANITGNSIRIFLPELSAERKEELIKYAKKIVEEHKIRIRQIRDTLNKEIEKDFDEGILREDLKFKIKEKIQEHVEKINSEIDNILENKIKEIKE